MVWDIGGFKLAIAHSHSGLKLLTWNAKLEVRYRDSVRTTGRALNRMYVLIEVTGLNLNCSACSGAHCGGTQHWQSDYSEKLVPLLW